MRRGWMFCALLVAVTIWVVGPALAADAKYVGYKKCKGCHSYQHKVWKNFKHAKASEAIKDEQKKDSSIFPCHWS